MRNCSPVANSSLVHGYGRDFPVFLISDDANFISRFAISSFFLPRKRSPIKPFSPYSTGCTHPGFFTMPEDKNPIFQSNYSPISLFPWPASGLPPLTDPFSHCRWPVLERFVGRLYQHPSKGLCFFFGLFLLGSSYW